RVLYKQHESQLAKGYIKVLDLGILAKGVYIVTVSTANGVSTQQIVKE
ncbi:MAG: T9SS type A sorting domain-containing protein, partial [Chitinophagales bacterium]|nr:T9SS type A sorting domain-containing protein [Chitinophagales bacterium]